jgi:hypothetical protein
MPVPASSAPLASAIFASLDKAPKLISVTNRGMARLSGFRALGPIMVLVLTAASSIRGCFHSWAGKNCISFHFKRQIFVKNIHIPEIQKPFL